MKKSILGLQKWVKQIVCGALVVGILLGTVAGSVYAAQVEDTTTACEQLSDAKIEEWAAKHSELRVGFAVDYMPFCGLDENGEVTGVITFLMDQIIEKLGLTDRVKIKYVGYESFRAVEEAYGRNEIDLSFPVIAQQSNLDRIGINGTQAVVMAPFYVAYDGTYSDSTFDAIALSTRPIVEITDNYPNSEIVTVSKAEECLDAILDGRATCTIMASYRLMHIMNETKYRDLKTIPFSASISYCIGVNPNQEDLLPVIDTGVSRVEKAVITDNIFKCIQSGARYSTSEFVRDHAYELILLIVVFCVIAFLLIYIYAKKIKKAKKAVERQLAENQKLSQEQAETNAALLFDCTFYYSFDVTEGMIDGKFLSLDGYDPAFHLDVSFPMSYDAFNAMRTEEFGIHATTEEEQKYWTTAGIIEAFKRGERKLTIRYESEEMDRYWNAFIVTTEDPANGHLHAIYICKEVTSIVQSELMQKKELSKALAEAQRASAAKADFLTRVSHDIRTPLNGIIGLMEINEKHHDDKEFVDANRKKARVAADHLLSLINDVLDMNKLEDTKTELSSEPFNLLELCREVMTICEIRARENGITPVHDSGVELKYLNLYGSPLHMKRIFLNLFNNAIKYNKPGGRIYFSSSIHEYDGDHVTYDFVVRDTGIGMSKEYLEKLYEPFTQERSDARSRYQGTGMGMAIVKSLVEKMDGEILCESELGVGTTFTIRLPFKINHDADSLVTKEQEEGTQSIEGLRILLVEDNELNMEIARTILEDAGADVTSAENGRKAVDTFMEKAPGSFDIILMDIMMPELDGYGATREIRQSAKADGQTIPIIAMTANAFAEDVQKAKESGMNHHLSKPLQVDKMIEIVARYGKQS